MVVFRDFLIELVAAELVSHLPPKGPALCWIQCSAHQTRHTGRRNLFQPTGTDKVLNLLEFADFVWPLEQVKQCQQGVCLAAAKCGLKLDYGFNFGVARHALHDIDEQLGQPVREVGLGEKGCGIAIICRTASGQHGGEIGCES